MAALGTLESQIFAKDIQNGLWPLNDFLSMCKDDTAFVNNNKVNLPHAGTAPAVVEGRSAASTPAKRTDAVTQYDLSELSTDATWLQYSEELIVSYNKRESILSEHKNALKKSMAEKVAYKWARGGDTVSSTNWTNKPTKVPTTGTTGRATNLPTVGSGGVAVTGNRKPVLFADILSVISALNYADVPADGRIAVIPAHFLSDLLQIDEFVNSDFVNTKPLTNAPLTFNWLGMKWFVRSVVTKWTLTSTSLLKDPTAASVATDCAGGVFYQKDFVRAAKGDVKVFLNVDQANIYGSMMSALARYGAIGARSSSEGIVNLVEATAS